MLTSPNRRRVKVIGLVCLVCLVGCNREALMHTYLPQHAQSDAEAYFNQIRNHQVDQIEGQIDPSVGGPDDIHEALVKMAGLFPLGAPKSVKLVGFNSLETPDVATDSMTLEYEFPQKWLVADVTTQKRGGVTTITSLHVTQMSAPLEHVNRFTLQGKGVGQFAMLVLWLMAVLLTLFAFFLCVRTRIERRKWLWMIFILLGVGQIAVNWTTNESSFRLFHIQMPPSMATAAIYGPWILSVSLPLGAIVFLVKRRSLASSATVGRS